MKTCGTPLLQFLRHGAVTLLASATLWTAVNRGTIRGTVTDPQGKVIPEVNIVILNTGTEVRQETKTNAAGFYLMPELIPGTYTVYFECPGFIPLDVARVEVKPNGVATVDMQLQLGRMTQHIEVAAAAPLVDTSSSNFAVPVEQHYMQNIPV